MLIAAAVARVEIQGAYDNLQAGPQMECPGTNSPFLHAHAKLVANVEAPCADVREEMEARLKGENGWKDPHNGGTYSLLEARTDSLKVKRVTGNRIFVDKMVLTLKDSSNGCQVMGCSESQGPSAADGSTNFCNMHDLYCSSADKCPVVKHELKYTEQAWGMGGASTKKSDCTPNRFTVLEQIQAMPVAARPPAMKCPGTGFPLLHASAELDATVSASCSDVKTEVKARVAGENGWKDPHNGGTYSMLADNGNQMTIKRVTGNRIFTDKLVLTLQDQGSSCRVLGCSESQGPSAADGSTNLCNMHVLFCGSQDNCPVVKGDFQNQEKSWAFGGAGNNKRQCIA